MAKTLGTALELKGLLRLSTIIPSKYKIVHTSLQDGVCIKFSISEDITAHISKTDCHITREVLFSIVALATSGFQDAERKCWYISEPKAALLGMRTSSIGV
jgi:hypothetical protein